MPKERKLRMEPRKHYSEQDIQAALKEIPE